jgi:hypothetical protein
MAKINISFNEKNYSIDPASLADATAELKTHLSSVINGSGATINFGGTVYSINSTKLSNATNDFITHLRMIAGNGLRVVVNGVEYGIDSTKIADAVAALETVLNGLNNPEAPGNAAVLDEAVLDYSVLA